MDQGFRVNINPSSDEDLSSDSGVSFKTYSSNGRMIDFSLMRRKHISYLYLRSLLPSGAPTAGPRLQVKPDPLGLSTKDRSLKMAQLMQISDLQTEFQMTDSQLQQRPDCPEHRGIMDEDFLKRMVNINTSSEVEEEDEDEDLCSDSGVSESSDRSNDLLIDFSLKWADFNSSSEKELKEEEEEEEEEEELTAAGGGVVQSSDDLRMEGKGSSPSGLLPEKKSSGRIRNRSNPMYWPDF